MVRFVLFLLLAKICMVCCGIWAIVEFILYLFKDDPFNWWSIGLCIFSFVLMIAPFILALIVGSSSSDDDTPRIPKTKVKSRFQERLEEMAKERGYKNDDN